MDMPRLSPALMSAMTLPDVPASDDPDWIHLLPAGQMVETVDDRGPYRSGDLQQIIAASYADGHVPHIDINHSVDLAAPRGEPSPAVGRIVEMQARADGIWGRVDWNTAGKTARREREYSGISPVLMVDTKKTIHRIPRASLVNRANLRGLTTLHQEQKGSPMTWLTKMLGLADDATEDEMRAALSKKLEGKGEGKGETAAMQSAMAEIGAALGVGSDLAEITAAARAAASDSRTVKPALQAQVDEMASAMAAMLEGGKRSRAVAFIDGEIAGLRMGLNKGNRDEFVTMHMENAERTENLVRGFAKMAPSGGRVEPRLSTALQNQQPGEIAQAATAYQAKMQKLGVSLNFVQAIAAIEEGKS